MTMGNEVAMPVGVMNDKNMGKFLLHVFFFIYGALIQHAPRANCIFGGMGRRVLLCL